ncbi:MAG: hypothetical protein ACREF4_06500 [Gammaproteobacteria bacterium]
MLLTGCENPTRPTDSQTGTQESVAAAQGPGDEFDLKATGEPFDDAEVFFEFNTTENDLGLQVFVDADGWKRLRVSDPAKRKVVDIMALSNLKELGITELRFESAEPSPAEVLALFPAGQYTLQGKTVDGENLLSLATLSHNFLTPPTFSPANGQTVNPASTVVTWNAPGAVRVEVIIEDANANRVFDVIVPGSTTSLNVPPQFLASGMTWVIEILAIGANGNRTIAESTFVTS